MKTVRTGAAHDALDQVDKALAKLGDGKFLDEPARRAAAEVLGGLDALTRYVDDMRAAFIRDLNAIPGGVDDVAQTLDEDDSA